MFKASTYFIKYPVYSVSIQINAKLVSEIDRTYKVSCYAFLSRAPRLKPPDAHDTWFADRFLVGSCDGTALASLRERVLDFGD